MMPVLSAVVLRMYKESNGKVYVYAGDCPYSLGKIASVYYDKTDGNEVWLTITVDRGNREFISEFSMIMENGVWKIGAATYPRY